MWFFGLLYPFGTWDYILKPYYVKRVTDDRVRVAHYSRDASEGRKAACALSYQSHSQAEGLKGRARRREQFKSFARRLPDYR